MKTYSKASRLACLYSTLQNLGFTFYEADILRRAELTLCRWAERECNGEIRRDETTGKVFFYSNSRGEHYAHAGHVPDRETGALKRVKAVLDARNARQSGTPGDLTFYHQTDPRGCALYILGPGDVPEGERPDVHYARGIAVCI